MGSSTCVVVVAVIVVVAIITISLLATSLKRLESKEMGLQYNTVEKDLDDEVMTEGLHTGPPGFEFIVFPNIFKSMQLNEIYCYNKEGIKIKLQISYQYRVKMSHLRKIVLLFKDYDTYEDLLIREGLAGMHESCSSFNTSQFQTERGEFENDLDTRITARYEKIGCDVEGMQVNNIFRPDQYEDAIKSMEQAKEDITVAERELKRQEIEMNTELKEAEVEAEVILTKAKSEARILNQVAERKAGTIKEQYKQEALAYKSIIGKDGLGFSPEAFISYMGVRVISDAKNPVFIGLSGPAESSYTRR